ncbi:MAG: LysE family translocator [Pseudorhodoplanes sp.]
MEFLPSLNVLLAFTATALVLIVTPGPDMTLFISQTLTAGRARGFAAMLGAFSGVLVHTLLASFGLSALLAASATAFTVVKWIGAAYLVFLAIDAIRNGSALSVRSEAAPPRPLVQVYFMAVGVNLLNPKVVMFFVTFLPQFVSVADPHAGAKMLFLGLYFDLLGLPVSALIVLGAEKFTATIRRSPRTMRIIDWSFAGLMSAFAARLLFTRGS